MSKFKPLYLRGFYESDDDHFNPLEITISYSEIESDELNEKIAAVIKDFENRYIFKTESAGVYGKSARGE